MCILTKDIISLEAIELSIKLNQTLKLYRYLDDLILSLMTKRSIKPNKTR